MENTTRLEDIDAVTKKIDSVISADLLAQEISSYLKNLQKKVSVKGFRPGKVPPSLVESLHGEQVHFEVSNRLISSQLTQILKSNDLRIIGSPRVEIAPYQKGKDMRFTATVSLLPRPELKDYTGIPIKVTKTEPSNQDIDEGLEEIRKSHASVRKLEAKSIAERGDVAFVTLEVLMSGEENSRPEQTTLELGEGKFPDVEQALEGMAVGEKKEIQVKFPSSHPNPKARNKSSTFKVLLEALGEKVLPEADDDFARRLNLGTLLELRLDIRKQLEKVHEANTRTMVENEILSYLITQYPFEVPNELVEEELQQLFSQYGTPQEKTEQLRIDLKELALRKIKNSIIINRIVELEKLKVSVEEMQEHLKALAQEYHLSREEAQKLLTREDVIRSINLDLLQGKAMSFLIDNAKVEYLEPEPVR